MDYKDLRSIQEAYNAIHSEEVVSEGKYSSGSVTYVKGTAPVRATYGGKTETFPKETYKKKGMVRTAEEVEDIQELDIGGAVKGALKRGAEFMDKNPVGKAVSNVLKPVAPGRRTARPSVRTQNTIRQNQSSMEEVDVFDIVKGHLIDEGLTEEEAIAKMVNMTQEEMQSILEG